MTALSLRSCCVLAILAILGVPALAAAGEPPPPETHDYREVDGETLKAYVFAPDGHDREGAAPAVLLFHGGGWTAGRPEWTFEASRRFAGLGLVAIAVEYRLSGDGVTPVEALADVCTAFRWARSQAGQLGLDPERVAGYGVSAGGHLVAAAATVGCGDGGAEGPDALLLWSPALDVARDGWFRRLVAGRADPGDLSPVEHVGPATPPTVIVHGELDTLTPLDGVERFCARLAELGTPCELHVYPGVGHLLTRNLDNQESDFDPDPGFRAEGIRALDGFLRRLGYLPDVAPGR